MLQINTTLCTTTTRLSPRLWWRFTALFSTSPTAIPTESTHLSTKDEVKSQNSGHAQNDEPNNVADQKKPTRFIKDKPDIRKDANSKSVINDKIESAQSLNELLDVLKLPNITQENNVKVMSNITKLVNSGNADISSIQNDTRFVNLQKRIRHTETLKRGGVKEASEFHNYTNLSIPAMIQVISNLAVTKNRDIVLLRFLSHNIVEYGSTLKIGQIASLQYSSATLNYFNEDLLNKIVADLLQTDLSEKPSSLESIITSMGMLKYKNEKFLNYLCKFLLTSKISLTPQQQISILLTFATLGYTSENANLVTERFMQMILPGKILPEKWLDFVWSLIILNKAQNEHVETVLKGDFIRKLKVTKSVTSAAKIMKILNINAATKFALKDYSGPSFTNDSPLFDMSLVRTNEKEVHVTALSETLSSIVQSTSHFKTNVNTGMGFLIDGVLHMDSDLKPIPIKDSTNSSDVTRIALLVNIYSDYCRGQKDLLGIVNFYNRALKSEGYHVLNISYENFSPQDKLDKRVKYLRERINQIRENESV